MSAGTLKAGSLQAFGVNSDTTVTGLLDLDGFDNTIGKLDGAGNVVADNDSAGSATLKVGGGDATGGLFFGVLSDGTGAGSELSLTKIGTGTQTLSGINTYTGATTINDGTLQAGSTQAFGVNSDVTVNMTTAPPTDGILRLNGFDNTIGKLNGNGTVENGSNVSEATLTMGGGDKTGGVFSGIFRDGGTQPLHLCKIGTGTQTISGGPSVITGDTKVDGGWHPANFQHRQPAVAGSRRQGHVDLRRGWHIYRHPRCQHQRQRRGCLRNAHRQWGHTV